jgi:hypothetical protein
VVPGEGRRALAEACKGFGLTLSGIGVMLKLTHTSAFSFLETYLAQREGGCAVAEACKGFGLTLSGIGGMLKLTHTSSVAFFKTYVVHPASVKLFDEYIVKDTGRCSLAEGCKRLDLSLAAIGTRFNQPNPPTYKLLQAFVVNEQGRNKLGDELLRSGSTLAEFDQLLLRPKPPTYKSVSAMLLPQPGHPDIDTHTMENKKDEGGNDKGSLSLTKKVCAPEHPQDTHARDFRLPATVACPVPLSINT